MAAARDEYRDRLFSFLFGSNEHKDWTLSLYNAVNGTSYTDPEMITITTIRQVLYMGMHNDVSFMIVEEMNLFEQQSRGKRYVLRTLQAINGRRNLPRMRQTVQTGRSAGGPLLPAV